MCPRSTSVASLPITIPAPLRPTIVMNRPIPAVIPNFRFFGTSFTSFSLKLQNESSTKMIPSHRTAASAIHQGSLTPSAIVGPHTE